MTSQQPSANAGSLLDLRNWNKGLAATVAIVGLGISLITYFIAAKTFLNAQIERTVKERLGPYLALTNALNLNQTGDWEEAIATLRPLIAGPDTTNLSPAARIQVADAFILAVAYSERPTRHGAEFNRARRLLHDVAPETGWRNVQIGWFYLRTGRQDLADARFSRALQLYEAESKWTESADAFRGLHYSALAAGHGKAAFDFAREAAGRNPVLYDLTVLRQEIRNLPRERWFADMRGHYSRTLDAGVRELTGVLDTVPPARAGQDTPPPP